MAGFIELGRAGRDIELARMRQEIVAEQERKARLAAGLPVDEEVEAEVVEETVEEAVVKPTNLKCEQCGFIAKAAIGLKAHARKHEKE